MWWSDWVDHGPAYGPPGWIFPLIWLVVLGVIITCVVLLRRRAERRAGIRGGETVLAERYAKGEIDEEEYRQRRAVLQNRTT